MTRPTAKLHQDRRGYLTYYDATPSCIDMFHGHSAALSIARFANKHAGKKVKRVIVAKQHFMVVDVR